MFSDLCFGLAEMGWKVTVLGTHPYYPDWKRNWPGNPWRRSRETIRGVEVLRHGIYVPSSPSKLVPRLVFEFSFTLSLLRSTWDCGRFDAVMVFCPLLGSVLFSSIRRLFRDEPVWLNVQDIPADAAAASGISNSTVFNRLASTAQGWLFNQADVWSTISPVMLERLSGMQRRNQPLHLCPNWLNGSLAEHVAALPGKLGRPPAQPVRMLYAGNIGKKQGLLDFCQRLAATTAAFHFQIHGNGGEAGSVRQWVANSGDQRFAFGDFLDESGFTQALHQADVFVITEKAGAGASFIPSKLIPSIASGTPVFAVCDRSGPLGQEMAAAGLGVILEWDNFERLAATLASLTGEPARFRGFQANCLAHGQNYQRNVAIPRFARLIEQMAQRSS